MSQTMHETREEADSVSRARSNKTTSGTARQNTKNTTSLTAVDGFAFADAGR